MCTLWWLPIREIEILSENFAECIHGARGQKARHHPLELCISSRPLLVYYKLIFIGTYMQAADFPWLKEVKQ